MNRFLIFQIAFCLSLMQNLVAQGPVFGDKTNEGLGSYSFIEKDASVFSTLIRDNNTDTKSLSVKFTLINPNGSKQTFTQNTLDQNGWQCSGDQSLSKKTNTIFVKDLAANAQAGSRMFSGIFKTDCKNEVSPKNESGYNEVITDIIDIQTQYHPNLSDEVLTNNSKYLVGAFKIEPADIKNVLTRLRIINKGSAKEGEVISNEALKIYYESSHSAFRFDGDEKMAGILYGNDQNDVSTNNIYQNSELNIPLQEGVWIYVVMQSNSDPDASNVDLDQLTISLAISTDGLSIGNGANDAGNVRIDEINISENKSIALPLKWISFDGWERKNSILLQWVTSSELNVDHFIIESCLDKTNWINIGTVKVNDNPSSTYLFEDQRNIRGINYYRIIQIDKNAEKSLSKVVAVKKIDRTRFLVYPNNTNSILSVTNELGERYSGPIEVFDVSGKKYKLNADNDSYIVSQLQAGVYFVLIGDEFLKFIKY